MQKKNLNGIILINKPQNWTSHDVVNVVRSWARKESGDKKIKVGHAGTLDPMATGVLPVCIGRATKYVDNIAGESKIYRTTLRLGITTDTQDIWGTQAPFEATPSQTKDIAKTIKSFIGKITQIPPMYSAIKIGGEKLYEKARRGETVERTPRTVTIHNIEILGVKPPQTIITKQAPPLPERHCETNDFPPNTSLRDERNESWQSTNTMSAIGRPLPSINPEQRQKTEGPGLPRSSKDFARNDGASTIDIELRVSCSKGTYIRTLCHDIGAALGTGGCMSSLIRESVGNFTLEECTSSLESRTSGTPSVFHFVNMSVCLGTFDGVHEGHQTLINLAKTPETKTTALVIEPENGAGCTLLSPQEKKEKLHAAGADFIIPIPLKSIKSMPAEEFFEEYILRRLNAKTLCVGFNFHFGRNRQAGIKELQTLCTKHHIQLRILPPIKNAAGEIISSSLLRKEKANHPNP